MIPFVIAFALVQVTTWLLGAYVTGLEQSDAEPETWMGFLVPVVLVPVACGWIGAEIAAIVRPFDQRRRTALVHGVRWGVCGVIAGLLTILAEGVALTINAERLSDYWIMGGCSLLVSLAAVALFPRAYAKGGCPGCGYDWSGLGRCPECGAAKA